MTNKQFEQIECVSKKLWENINNGHEYSMVTYTEFLGIVTEVWEKLQEEPESIWHNIEELSIARDYEYILVIYKDTMTPRVAGNKTQVSHWDRVDKWAYIDDLLKF